ncbi:hypothetical protein [Sphingomonas rubra]|uniref:Uncharacterized protein n=1 Tax=Sphingomonas rubra TaxID=634430 RepID=A0A1I5SRL1_9SPHN|nr:hypothetical protein [Sphingomonas rubra]SFP73432.1 hypothetical protein SAMN04488241_10692 [Sphingomonas rubra]
MTERPEPSQPLQRIKVGLIGLFAVVLLIALASAILGSATRDQSPAGLAQGNLVAQIAAGNASGAATGEPLAEMGVAPSAGNVQDGGAPR